MYKIIPFLLGFPSLPTIRNEMENDTIWQIVAEYAFGILH